MKLRQLHECYASPEGIFDYGEISREVWREKFGEAKDEFGVNFDLENDDHVADRDIKIDNKSREQYKKGEPTGKPEVTKFKCEMRKGGGDWECASIYFRCQLVDGYVSKNSKIKKYGGESSLFVVIPDNNTGNPHHIQNHPKYSSSKDTFRPPDADYYKEVEEPNERKAWQFLKDYLEKLVNG